MRPYFEQAGIRIYHGDCREVLPTLNLADVGCVVADPPYGETSLEWDRWPDDWPEHLAACPSLPESASLWCFGSLRMMMERSEELLYRWFLAQDLVWEKHNGSGSAADRFRRVHELAAHFYRGAWANVWNQPVVTMDATARAVRRKGRPAHWGEIGASSYESGDGGPRLMRSVIAVRSEHGRAEHPTQKPIGIVEPLLRASLGPYRLVLEPFMGSGTALVVAKSMGRGGIGIDVDERWCEVAARRVSQEMALGGMA